MYIWSMFTLTKFMIFTFVLMGFTACQAREQIKIEMPSGEQVAFFVDVAYTPETQAKGLMFVEDMPDNHGMIFAYPEPTPTQFWMKNTLIPLDILFFDSNNKLIDVVHSAKPHDLTPVGPLSPICNVVELNGGTVKAQGIDVGAQLITDINQECLQSLPK